MAVANAVLAAMLTLALSTDQVSVCRDGGVCMYHGSIVYTHLSQAQVSALFCAHNGDDQSGVCIFSSSGVSYNTALVAMLT